MSTHLNARQESFCRHYARHGTGALAAREAGYGAENACQQASRLLSLPHIQARTADLRAGAQTARERDQDALVVRLKRIYDQALESGALAVAVRAVEAEARIRGLIFARLPDMGAAARDQPRPWTGGQRDYSRDAYSAQDDDDGQDEFLADILERSQAVLDEYESKIAVGG